MIERSNLFTASINTQVYGLHSSLFLELLHLETPSGIERQYTTRS
jgi:hypothetical protein